MSHLVNFQKLRHKCNLSAIYVILYQNCTNLNKSKFKNEATFCQTQIEKNLVYFHSCKTFQENFRNSQEFDTLLIYLWGMICLVHGESTTKMEVQGSSSTLLLTVDEILPYIGEFGRYQILLDVAVFVVMCPVALHPVLMYFSTLVPDWKCNTSVISTCVSNQTFRYTIILLSPSCESLNCCKWKYSS